MDYMKIYEKFRGALLNSIPVPSEFLVMHRKELCELITQNIANVVYVQFTQKTINIYFPGRPSKTIDIMHTNMLPYESMMMDKLRYIEKQNGKENQNQNENKGKIIESSLTYLPSKISYGGWMGILTILNGIGENARQNGYPVFIESVLFDKTEIISNFYFNDQIIKLNDFRKPITVCYWCGKKTPKPKGKTIPFCMDGNCKKKYIHFRSLLLKLCSENLISYDEASIGVNMSLWCFDAESRYILNYIVNNGQNLIDEMKVDCGKNPSDMPQISRNFYLKDNGYVGFKVEGETNQTSCENCGGLFYNRKGKRFCSDTCRYKFHNKKKLSG